MVVEKVLKFRRSPGIVNELAFGTMHDARFAGLLAGVVAALVFGAAAGPIWGQSYTMSTVAGADRLRNGKQATTTPLRQPFGTAQDAQGNIYIVDNVDDRIRREAPDGAITTIAGTGRAGFRGDDGPALAPR
jgi:hypothetical protein